MPPASSLRHPQVVSVAHTFVEVWEGVAALLAELDVLLGFADLAVTAPTPYVRPEMLAPETGEITLSGSRHPCVEVQVGFEFGQIQMLLFKLNLNCGFCILGA